MNDAVPGLGVCVSQYLNTSNTCCPLNCFFPLFWEKKNLPILYYTIKLLQCCQHTKVADTCHYGQKTSSICLEIRNTITAQTQGLSIILLTQSEAGSRSNLTRKACFCEISSKKKSIFKRYVCTQFHFLICSPQFQPLAG